MSLTSILSIDICPFLLYLSYPYYETFHAGGFFPWVKNQNTVIVQCPHKNGAVEIEIRRRSINNNVEIHGEIIKVKGECIWACKEGMTVEFDLALFKRTCFKAYNLLFPHLLSLILIEVDGPVIKISCPKSNGTVFEITATNLSRNGL